jgi:signal transduction histidine kinase
MSGGCLPRWSRRAWIRAVRAALLAAAFFAAAGRSAQADTAADAKALLERAVAHIQAVGAARAYADITRPDGGFVEGELYVFCTTPDGTMLAHGGNPKLVGRNLMAIRDPEGTPTTATIIRVGQTQGQGWLEYLWPNPTTGRVQRKATYVIRIDERTICASGYFKPEPP